jgi:hypothetical protein
MPSPQADFCVSLAWESCKLPGSVFGTTLPIRCTAPKVSNQIAWS